jgi:pyruvate formate lyase activating enzyme
LTFSTAVRNVDSIERKPLYHFRPGSRALTLAAPGCTFACTYCQNHRLSQWGRDGEAAWRGAPVDPDEIVTTAKRNGQIIAFSYSEPILASELTLALAPLARDAGVPIVWKTNGFITEGAARHLSTAIAAVNVDLKSPVEADHRRLTRAPLAPVLRAVEVWKAQGVWIEISTAVIAGLNDSDEQIRALARIVRGWGRSTPWHLLRVHPDYRMTDISPTHPAALERARQIAHEEGLDHVYVERALGPDGRATTCPECKARVIERGIWSVERVLLVSGCCPQCGQPIQGRW